MILIGATLSYVFATFFRGADDIGLYRFGVFVLTCAIVFPGAILLTVSFGVLISQIIGLSLPVGFDSLIGGILIGTLGGAFGGAFVSTQVPTDRG